MEVQVNISITMEFECIAAVSRIYLIIVGENYEKE